MILYGGVDVRVLMTGGGTGGHVNPAIAIAEIIKEKHPDAEIAFVGTKNGIENKLVTKAGYKLYHIEIQGIRRSLSLSNIKTAYLVMVSPKRARKIIEEFKPDVVIGTGGYVCWPTVKAAAAMNIPTLLHESNALAGIAVKQLKNDVDTIMTNFDFPQSALRTKKRVVRVGNPISASFGKYNKNDARKQLGIDPSKTLILSFGGSVGSSSVNKAVFELMKNFSASRDDIVHFHSVGRAGAESMEEKMREYGLSDKKNIFVSEYIYNMPVLMAAADIVICRAGAMTLSEIAVMKKASVIIPSPYVADDHQYKNAKVLADADAALLVQEFKNKDIDSDKLIREVKLLADNRSLRLSIENKIAEFASDQVNEKIYAEIDQALKNKKFK